MGNGRRRRPGEPEVHVITSAPDPLADDQARRQRRYLLQMGLRVLCFLAAVLAWPHLPRLVAIALVVAATVLPYIAVLGANAGRERNETDPEPPARQLPAAAPHEALGGGDR
jgi:hypothetical protein